MSDDDDFEGEFDGPDADAEFAAEPDGSAGETDTEAEGDADKKSDREGVVAAEGDADADSDADDADDADEEVVIDVDGEGPPGGRRFAGRSLASISNQPRVVRVVPDEDRVTDCRVHRSEMAQIIAVRASQIASTSRHFTPGGSGDQSTDPVELAIQEFYARRCPFRLRRRVGTTPAGDDIVEEWNVREMALPPMDAPRAR
jgi:DNA-directed RNA polymerase subunit K/omega